MEVINNDGSITLYAVECPATRTFPIYICWEEVSAENADKVSGKYGSWSKDNGDTWELTRTDWGGEIRKGDIGKAFWCLYGKGDVNILAIAEKSADEYIVSFNGEDVGKLTDLA